MREKEKLLNQNDDKQNISVPVFWSVAAVCILIGLLIWFGIKNPNVFSNVRDLTITLIAFLFFVISTALAVLFFYLSSRISDAKAAIDQAMTKADGKVEELGDKITEILKQILEPVFDTKSKKAGILNIFRTMKENKEK